MSRSLIVRGAREHNLKDIDLDIPRDRLVVITGPSGSGKSSLAFDTIFAEGRRRYVESLSVYARRFLKQLPKPDVDLIEGLSPAICIEQRTTVRGPRSTVGTVTEIYDYLRLLFARVAEPTCPEGGTLLPAHTVEQMVEQALTRAEGARFAVLAPIARGEQGDFADTLEDLRREGYVRVIVDGAQLELEEGLRLDPGRPHEILVVVDRLSVRERSRQRLREALELALGLAAGLVCLRFSGEGGGGEDLWLSDRARCEGCDPGRAADARPEEEGGPPTVFPRDLTPSHFSFNSADGACRVCGGLGAVLAFEEAKVIPDPSLSIAGGAIAPWGKAGGPFHRAMLTKLGRGLKVALDKPWSKLPAKARERLLFGGRTKGAQEEWEGVIGGLERRALEVARRKRTEGAASVEHLEEELVRYGRRAPCGSCGGSRLRPLALAYRLGEKNIHELSVAPVGELLAFFEGLELPGNRAAIADRILEEVRQRLRFLAEVGLSYLSLDRPASTLSGGEAQRIRLASQIGSALVGVLYVLDEPSIGLHARDHARLLGTLARLRDAGNTVLVVEHDEETIRAADHVIDLGPGAGRLGGEVMATGTPQQIEAAEGSPTGAYLSGRRSVSVPKKRRRAKGALQLSGASLHNLKDLSLEIPLGVLIGVSGVSGSGKSSLILDTLVPLLKGEPGPAGAKLRGGSAIDKVIDIDQQPIGRSARSNPATYTGIFSAVRDLFASLPEARARGYDASRFSFNVKGGRCEACQGDGEVKVELHFLPDFYVTCEVCKGARYGRETLELRYRGMSIADVLALPIQETLQLFGAIPKLRAKLEVLDRIGLGYLTLGQSANTLSGGEAQRLKLAKELSRRSTGSTFYVLDEPTTGLHFSDVEVLIGGLQSLVEEGNTVLVIEHSLDILKVADHLIDLGPDGGAGGGRIVAQGTPEEVAKVKASHTGRVLGPMLGRK